MIPKTCKRLAEVDFTIAEGLGPSASLSWLEVTKISNYYLAVDAIKQPMVVRDNGKKYGDDR